MAKAYIKTWDENSKATYLGRFNRLTEVQQNDANDFTTENTLKNFIDETLNISQPQDRVETPSIVLALGESKQKQLWQSVVRVSVGVDDTGSETVSDSCSGVILYADKTSFILLVNLHSFCDLKTSKPLHGFPPGFDKEFNTLVRELAHVKKRKLQESQVDPLRLKVQQKISPNAWRVICKNEALDKNSIRYISGHKDALLLTLPYSEVDLSIAPTDFSLMSTQKVHVFGFADVGGHEAFCIPGEVTSITDHTFCVDLNSTPGLSGGAVVCDGLGAVIGYVGGALEPGKRQFGAYAFPIAPVVTELNQLLKP